MGTEKRWNDVIGGTTTAMIEKTKITFDPYKVDGAPTNKLNRSRTATALVSPSFSYRHLSLLEVCPVERNLGTDFVADFVKCVLQVSA
jgi:hypothetical protein